VIGMDIGKNSFHIVGHDQRGAIVLRQKWSRGQVETRLANLPPCLIGMEACVGAHHSVANCKCLATTRAVPIRRDRRMTSVMPKPSRGGAAADDHPPASPQDLYLGFSPFALGVPDVGAVCPLQFAVQSASAARQRFEYIA
jgi:hypothetical protein